MIQNSSSQSADFRGKRVLSAFLLFRVEKCHQSKKNALESICLRKIFTSFGCFSKSLQGIVALYGHNDLRLGIKLFQVRGVIFINYRNYAQVSLFLIFLFSYYLICLC